MRTFRKSSTVLFFFDTDDKHTAVLVNTVADNQYKYSTTSYSRALMARKLQHIIGRPSTQDFVKILYSNSLPNSPVTYRDVTLVENIFGPDFRSLEGKTVRWTPNRLILNKVEIPSNIYEEYRDVIVACNDTHLSGLTLLVTISRHL
jgi:hypothetical protein